MSPRHNAEKDAIERATAESFVAAFNSLQHTTYRIVKMRDAPDVHCRDAAGTDLFLELRVFGDAAGTAAYMLGRGPDPLVGENKAPSYSLEHDTLREMTRATDEKAAKDYGHPVALVLRYIGGIWAANDFSGHTFDDAAKSRARSTFDAGVWVLVVGDGIARVV